MPEIAGGAKMTRDLVRGEPLVEILLATYNGGQYISEQLDSLLAQTYSNWRVLVHDDGSTDNTVERVRMYARRYPQKITLIEDGVKTGGAKNNFAHLMRLSTSSYIAFCDQDDVWMPHKIEMSLASCQEAEERLGAEMPIGVFSDLCVVDSALNVVSPSLWKLQGTVPSLADSIKRLSVRNCVTGCTLLINRSALLVSLPMPRVATMHDWWISLAVLKNGGVMRPIEEATVLYRQHVGNVVGAKAGGLRPVGAKAVRPVKTVRQILDNYRMAREVGAYTSAVTFLMIKIRAVTGIGFVK